MWKRVTGYPLITASVTGLGLLAGYWSLFTDKNIPAVLTKHQWALAMIPWYHAFIAMMGCAAVILYIVLIRNVGAKRRAVGWLEAVADEDSNNMVQRVRVDAGSMGTTSHLHAAEPYVDLRVSLLNSSVFALTLVNTEGKLTFQKSLLQHGPEIVSQSRTIGHAKHYALKLRQWLQPDTAQQILKDGGTEFGVGKVTVWFTYQDRAGAPRRVQITLGNLPFQVTAG